WTGVYVGLNLGYSWGRSRTHVDFFPAAGPPIVLLPGSVTAPDFKLNGGVFGGQIGANWQNGSFVGGVEADIQWTGQKGSADFRCAAPPFPAFPGPGTCLPAFAPVPPVGPFPSPALSLEQKLKWFGT